MGSQGDGGHRAGPLICGWPLSSGLVPGVGLILLQFGPGFDLVMGVFLFLFWVKLLTVND